MFKFFKVFGLSVISAGVCLLGGVADAATGRADYENVRTTSFVGSAQGGARMPSMPTLPIVAVGNVVKDVPNNNGDTNNDGGVQNPDDPNVPNDPDVVEDCWKDVPHATAGRRLETGACEIIECEKGWEVDANRRNCEKIVECPDGGVKNSDYTIDDCMRDLAACINNGALPNGINDMFNDDLRASIINGMGLCYNQVDKCIAGVRRNCENVYGSRADVWVDFNSRKVQPEYYSFVLRKTGLTPLQAENTCLLLDRNVYGKSFAGVGKTDNVTGEYNQAIGAYNAQLNNSLTKENPMGAAVNTNGLVDAKRGYYARWDAAAGECLIRVAAYNKDKQISNSWLFGAIGDDRPAEVWKKAGETFTCNKDLFGFSLMKDTATAALIGVGGGAVLGASIGAGIGAGVANKNAQFALGDCNNDQFRAELLKKIKSSTNMELLKRYLTQDISRADTTLNTTLCKEIVRLPEKYEAYDVMVAACEKAASKGKVSTFVTSAIECPADRFDDCIKQYIEDKYPAEYVNAHFGTVKQCLQESQYTEITNVKQKDGEQVTYTIRNYTINKESAYCRPATDIFAVMGFGMVPLGDCSFKNMDLVSQDAAREDLFCGTSKGCMTYIEARENLNMMKIVLEEFELDMIEPEKRGATIGKGVAIGAATGVGVGGLATAITALVEHDNINCRVGDGLGQVGLNKSYSIDFLKDLYVKWNLNLPDTQVLGNGTAVYDKTTWTDACKIYTSKEACESAQFYYKNSVGALEWIYSACEYDAVGLSCDPSATLLKSYDVK